MRLSTLLFFLFVNPSLSIAQNDSTHVHPPQLQVSGFVDVFYAYDFSSPSGNHRQPFLYNHNRHNEFALNLGLIKVAAWHKNYRANLALQTGTYAADNYAAEPFIYRNIFEANVGVALNPRKTLWLDAGIFSSHIGFESAISSDNWTLTRSLLAENSPYYLSGARLTFSPNDRWDFVGLLCNGWQRIQRLPGNSLLSAGSQISYRPGPNSVLNWSTFIGTDDPDYSRRMRYFNNLHGIIELNKKLGLIAGFDFGLQQRSKNSQHYNHWLSPVLIVRYKITEKWAAAARAEYYHDPEKVIIDSPSEKPFSVAGFSINADYLPAPKVMCRIEARAFNSSREIFAGSGAPGQNNFFLVGSVAVKLEK